MLTLVQALQQLPWHLIATIGRQHNLTLSSSLKKETLINQVSSPLLDPRYLTQLWPQLPEGGRQLLTDLLTNGGQLPAPQLSLRYGQRRPHRTLLAAHRRQQPLSIIEQLDLLGLIFWDQA